VIKNRWFISRPFIREIHNKNQPILVIKDG
jgi:hypothetical protein